MRIQAIVAASIVALAAASAPPVPACPSDTGLKLPSGFCATLFADSLPGPRHMVVAPNGDLIVALNGTRTQTTRTPGGVAILRDANGDGKADGVARFGEYSSSEVALVGEDLFVENGSAILRYKLRAGTTAPSGTPDTIVSGMPTGGHGAKTFVVRGGDLLVNQGSRTNSCQEKDRTKESKGVQPCAELEERAGIWRYSTSKVGQTPVNGEHYARGIRNAVGMAIDPQSNDLVVMQHGRDQLGDWPGFSAEKNAETPAEEMFR